MSTKSVFVGGLLGFALVAAEIYLAINGEHMTHTAIGETLWTAIYLTMAVAYVNFKLPTFFAKSHPRLAMWTLAVICGFVSLFFDSFAVILLLNTMTIKAFVENADVEGVTGGRFSPNFNRFAYKSVCAFNALTVGGAFYIGELWGLPHYISSGYALWWVGLPLLVVLAPYSMLISAITAWLFPVRFDNVKFDRAQWIGMAEIVGLLIAIIITHRPVGCIGGLLLYTVVMKTTPHLIEETLHEIKEGADAALGLIAVAFLIQIITPLNDLITSALNNEVAIFLLATLSSPLAGAMVPGSVEDPARFYVVISLVMLGATMLVSSSLVNIMIFKDQLAPEDLPGPLRLVHSLLFRGSPTLDEKIAYTALIIPINSGLAICLFLANYFNVFVWWHYTIRDMIGA